MEMIEIMYLTGSYKVYKSLRNVKPWAFFSVSWLLFNLPIVFPMFTWRFFPDVRLCLVLYLLLSTSSLGPGVF